MLKGWNLLKEISAWPLLFNIITEVLVITIGEEKGIKDIQIGKQKYDMTLYIDDLKEFIIKTYESQGWGIWAQYTQINCISKHLPWTIRN